MRYSLKDRSSLCSLVCALAISAGFVTPAAAAQGMGATAAISAQPPEPTARAKSTQPAVAAKRTPDQKPVTRYAIDFRSRHALSYGHTFVVYGPLNERGEIDPPEVAGLHPSGESSVPWSIGHVVPVVAETGASDGDLEEEYTTARYRILMSEAEYKKTAAYIRHLKANSPLWHASIYNCNAFAATIARSMGLQTPLTWLRPPNFINALIDMNGGVKPSAANHAAKVGPVSGHFASQLEFNPSR